MSEHKNDRFKDKPIKGSSATKTQTEKDVLSIADTHSQDADRHRKIRHPDSNK